MSRLLCHRQKICVCIAVIVASHLQKPALPAAETCLHQEELGNTMPVTHNLVNLFRCTQLISWEENRLKFL